MAEIQDGTLTYEQYSEKIDYMEGTSVLLECNSGYGLQGNAEAMCTNGEWTATLGTCIQCEYQSYSLLCTDMVHICLI